MVLAENLLFFRRVEYRGELRRVLAVLKMRFSDFDRTLREYTIKGVEGLGVRGPAPLAEGLLTGLALPLAPAVPLTNSTFGSESVS